MNKIKKEILIHYSNRFLTVTAINRVPQSSEIGVITQYRETPFERNDKVDRSKTYSIRLDMKKFKKFLFEKVSLGNNTQLNDRTRAILRWLSPELSNQTPTVTDEAAKAIKNLLYTYASENFGWSREPGFVAFLKKELASYYTEGLSYPMNWDYTYRHGKTTTQADDYIYNKDQIWTKI